MIKFLEYIFIIFLGLSILTALLLVFSQIFGLVIQSGDVMIDMNDLLLTPAIIFSAIFAGAAFILGYTPKYKKD